MGIRELCTTLSTPTSLLEQVVGKILKRLYITGVIFNVKYDTESCMSVYVLFSKFFVEKDMFCSNKR